MKSTHQTASERQQTGDNTQLSTSRRPHGARGPISKWGATHVKGIVIIRLCIALWLVCLGIVFITLWTWWGALLFVAAGLVGGLAFRTLRRRAPAP
jgi:hypothetical protein